MTHREAAGVYRKSTLRGRKLSAARVLNDFPGARLLKGATKTNDDSLAKRPV